MARCACATSAGAAQHSTLQCKGHPACTRDSLLTAPPPPSQVWVFNKSYTQYIPLSIYDLQVRAQGAARGGAEGRGRRRDSCGTCSVRVQAFSSVFLPPLTTPCTHPNLHTQTWVGTPAIYVFDCSAAGQILSSFRVRGAAQFPGGSGGLQAAAVGCSWCPDGAAQQHSPQLLLPIQRIPVPLPLQQFMFQRQQELEGSYLQHQHAAAAAAAGGLPPPMLPALVGYGGWVCSRGCERVVCA